MESSTVHQDTQRQNLRAAQIGQAPSASTGSIRLNAFILGEKNPDVP